MNKYIRLLIVFTVTMMMFINECPNIEAEESAITRLQKVNVEIKKVNEEYIEIILVNTGKEYCPYWGGFTLEKLKWKKWQYKSYIDGIAFRKTETLAANGTKIIRIKWKDYYGRNLSEGKYRIRLIKEKMFDINSECVAKQLRDFEAFDIVYSWFEESIYNYYNIIGVR